ncbi:unnamed protein product [Prorocentrum cordatum]|uniref:ABC1 atypical kinase-like domain-containing protein n=1 Tax=Prorocentrum cordatum TaxID=2364126 RepID=A0ABN9TP52_9DINO|nr:unnamed protein product [Polarella glacialis]
MRLASLMLSLGRLRLWLGRVGSSYGEARSAVGAAGAKRKDYQQFLASGARRPKTPVPDDRGIGERTWKKDMRNWRFQIRFALGAQQRPDAVSTGAPPEIFRLGAPGAEESWVSRKTNRDEVVQAIKWHSDYQRLLLSNTSITHVRAASTRPDRQNGVYPPGGDPEFMGKRQEVSLMEVMCEAEDVGLLADCDLGCDGGAAKRRAWPEDCPGLLAEGWPSGEDVREAAAGAQKLGPSAGGPGRQDPCARINAVEDVLVFRSPAMVYCPEAAGAFPSLAGDGARGCGPESLAAGGEITDPSGSSNFEFMAAARCRLAFFGATMRLCPCTRSSTSTHDTTPPDPSDRHATDSCSANVPFTTSIAHRQHQPQLAAMMSSTYLRQQMHCFADQGWKEKPAAAWANPGWKYTRSWRAPAAVGVDKRPAIANWAGERVPAAMAEAFSEVDGAWRPALVRVRAALALASACCAPRGVAARLLPRPLPAAGGLPLPGLQHGRRLLQVGLGAAAAVLLASSQNARWLGCETAPALALQAPSEEALAAMAAQASVAPRKRLRLRWVRVLWRCVVLMLHAVPVACAAPLCWLLWRHGGESVFWSLVLSMLQANGPIAVKFAQWAATRPDILPGGVCDHLSELQASVRPHPLKDTVRTLTKELGPEWRESLELDPVPVGSGCMAQVYRGWLRAEGGLRVREVALKVRHPGALEKVDLDLEVMSTLVGALEGAWPAVRYLALGEAVANFEVFLRPQADLRVEAANLDVFRRNFSYATSGDGLRVRFPEADGPALGQVEVVRPFVSEGVLVESFEHAVPLQAVLGCGRRRGGQDHSEAWHGLPLSEVREQVGSLCMSTFMKMLFSDNFVHGDMHPGNILFRYPDAGPAGPGKPEIVLIDAGLSVGLSRKDRRNFVELFHAIATDDGRRAAQLMVERSPGDRSQVVDEEGFVDSISRLISSARGGGVALGKVRIGDIFSEMLGLACSHRVKLETNFVKVANSIIVLEDGLYLSLSLSPSVFLSLSLMCDGGCIGIGMSSTSAYANTVSYSVADRRAELMIRPRLLRYQAWLHAQMRSA